MFLNINRYFTAACLKVSPHTSVLCTVPPDDGVDLVDQLLAVRLDVDADLAGGKLEKHIFQKGDLPVLFGGRVVMERLARIEVDINLEF